MQDTPEDTHRVAASELRQFIERYEGLEVEKKNIADQKKLLLSVPFSAPRYGQGKNNNILEIDKHIE